MADVEQELVRIARRYSARARALEDVTADRDEAIRRAIKAKVPRNRLAEIFGLSRQRLDQIRRGSRI
jgi:uncharacterized linocin/CFP29 family protein